MISKNVHHSKVLGVERVARMGLNTFQYAAFVVVRAFAITRQRKFQTSFLVIGHSMPIAIRIGFSPQIW